MTSVRLPDAQKPSAPVVRFSIDTVVGALDDESAARGVADGDSLVPACGGDA
ncbi:hypothetical protein [Nocardia flavorosea]|uniref:hypothetical protein n=1 Tax=Nocardia flavorosea TaxID=53429 RepID=UPI0012F4A3B7|nr:hypothetical protein [Nocardia flavorosea]